MRHAARVLLIGAVALGLPAHAHATPITLTAGSTTVSVGDTFDIPIFVGETTGLTSFQFDVGFNTSVVEFQGVSDTSTDFAAAAISLTGLTAFPQGSPVNFLSGVADSMFTLGTGLAPSGTIADIQFKALAPGTSPISFSCTLCQGAFLTDNLLLLSSATGGFTLQDGVVTVSGATPPPAVPEPTTLLLVGGGLAIAARRRARRN